MELLPLSTLGARETASGVLDFGVYFPWVSAADGNRLFVKIIHERDQFLQDVAPRRFELHHTPDPNYGDYWSAQVDLGAPPPSDPGPRWGQPGRYVYRFALERSGMEGELDWIVDPYAREFGIGNLYAITAGYQPHEWAESEKQWKVPALEDLVMYELMISE